MVERFLPVEDWDDLAWRSTISTGRQAWATAKGLGGNSRDGAHKSAARDPRGARRRRLEEGWQAGPSIKC